MTAHGVEKPRRIDRERRSRIVDGALRVIELHGVEGLTHRRVAAAAAVPLSATTYYFASLDDLLVAAMERAVARDLAALASAFAALPPGASIAAPLAATLVEGAGGARGGAVVITELYTAALRRERLREVALAWERGWEDVLVPRLGALGARIVASGLGGLLQHALLVGAPPSHDEALALVGRLLDGP